MHMSIETFCWLEQLDSSDDEADATKYSRTVVQEIPYASKAELVIQLEQLTSDTGFAPYDSIR